MRSLMSVAIPSHTALAYAVGLLAPLRQPRGRWLALVLTWVALAGLAQSAAAAQIVPSGFQSREIGGTLDFWHRLGSAAWSRFGVSACGTFDYLHEGTL